jgi:hypothetical protein
MVPIKRPLSVGYEGQWLSWKTNDPGYWSPQGYASHLAVLRLNQDFSRIGYEVQGAVGIAAERVEHLPQTGYGPAFGFGGAFSYMPSPRVKLALSVSYGQTVREAVSIVQGGANPGQATTELHSVSNVYWWLTSSASIGLVL